MKNIVPGGQLCIIPKDTYVFYNDFSSRLTSDNEICFVLRYVQGDYAEILSKYGIGEVFVTRLVKIKDEI